MVRKRRHGCLTGCLVRIILLLGFASILFVAACSIGIIENDPETGAPRLSVNGFSGIQLPRLPEKFDLPEWAYGVERTGLTVKTLHAGGGEAVLVCADGYTMLLGGGSGMGVTLTAQLLLCGVTKLNMAVATASDDLSIGALPGAMTILKPEYLIYQDSQVKGAAYDRMLSTAQKAGAQTMVASQGLTFNLGRARVTIVGPYRKRHTDDRDDSISLRVDYGQTSVLVMGGTTALGEGEMVHQGVYLGADALICAQGGAETATCAELVEAVQPKIALMTGKKAASKTAIRLQRAGAEVFSAKEHGVMTLYSDGETMTIRP